MPKVGSSLLPFAKKANKFQKFESKNMNFLPYSILRLYPCGVLTCWLKWFLGFQIWVNFKGGLIIGAGKIVLGKMRMVTITHRGF